MRFRITGRRTGIVAAAVAAIVLGLAGHSLLIEPFRIEVTRHVIRGSVPKPLTIAHLTDLHTSGLGRRELKMLALLEQERPDAIVITGDTTADTGTLEMSRDVLGKLNAPLGVWAVRGNWELWRPSTEERAFYESVGINFLLNSSRRLTEGIWLAGLDDPLVGAPDLDGALEGVPADVFTILLFHEPDFFDKTAGKCDLALSGHLHGGQVRFPWIGPLWLPARTRNFIEGWYESKGSRMYVSRGIGTSILPVRFNCRPEIALITIAREIGSSN